MATAGDNKSVHERNREGCHMTCTGCIYWRQLLTASERHLSALAFVAWGVACFLMAVMK